MTELHRVRSKPETENQQSFSMLDFCFDLRSTLTFQSNTNSVYYFSPLVVLVVPLGDALPDTKYGGEGIMDSVLASHPVARGSILGAPEIYRALLS